MQLPIPSHSDQSSVSSPVGMGQSWSRRRPQDPAQNLGAVCAHNSVLQPHNQSPRGGVLQSTIPIHRRCCHAGPSPDSWTQSLAFDGIFPGFLPGPAYELPYLNAQSTRFSGDFDAVPRVLLSATASIIDVIKLRWVVVPGGNQLAQR